MLAVLAGPTLVWTTMSHTQAAPYMWLARLASEFTCGMLLSASLPAGPSRPPRSVSWLAPGAVRRPVWLYVASVVDKPWLGPLVVVLFPALVLGLAQGDGALQRWLGSPPMVLGGGASFALYLVHVPLLKLFRDAVEHGVVPLDPGHQLDGELVVVLGSLALATSSSATSRSRCGTVAGLGSGVAEPVPIGASGRIRTCDTWYRKPVLYPLSYGGLRQKSDPGAMVKTTGRYSCVGN